MCTIMRRGAWKHWALGCCASLIATGSAWAAPTSGALSFQPPATDTAKEVQSFHNEILIIITVIMVFVTLLLAWVCIRYNKRANPVPKKFSHNTVVEILWTVVPVLILVFIAYRSFPLLYEEDVMPNVPEDQIVDIKVYGKQWAWVYQYGTGENVKEYESDIIRAKDINPEKGQIEQLSVNYPMVAPAGKYVRLSISAYDVIHAFAMPQFALKVDAVPGRLNQLWFKTDLPGVYYGQCSELCGKGHGYMPIELRILPEAQYNEWLTHARKSDDEARAYLDSVQPLPPTTATKVAAAQ
jgi:cytochrome c oxidase subunit II